MTRDVAQAFYPLYNESSKTLRQVIDLLIEEIGKGVDIQFNKAALILLNRSRQHFESIISLTEHGLYGDAWILLRSVLSDMSMIYYLHFNPHLLNMFLEEKVDDYQKNKKFKEAFSESRIIDSLEKHGAVITKTSFFKISKASHASSWGSRFFGQDDAKSSYSMKYGPGFEAKKAITLLSMILGGNLDYINAILMHRVQNQLDISSKPWLEIDEQEEKLRNPIKNLATKGVEIVVTRSEKS